MLYLLPKCGKARIPTWCFDHEGSCGYPFHRDSLNFAITSLCPPSDVPPTSMSTAYASWCDFPRFDMGTGSILHLVEVTGTFWYHMFSAARWQHLRKSEWLVLSTLVVWHPNAYAVLLAINAGRCEEYSRKGYGSIRQGSSRVDVL